MARLRAKRYRRLFRLSMGIPAAKEPDTQRPSAQRVRLTLERGLVADHVLRKSLCIGRHGGIDLQCSRLTKSGAQHGHPAIKPAPGGQAPLVRRYSHALLKCRLCL
jgi:hypothetical protein